MRVIYRKIRYMQKIWGARYTLGARYLSKNTVYATCTESVLGPVTMKRIHTSATTPASWTKTTENIYVKFGIRAHHEFPPPHPKENRELGFTTFIYILFNITNTQPVILPLKQQTCVPWKWTSNKGDMQNVYGSCILALQKWKTESQVLFQNTEHNRYH